MNPKVSILMPAYNAERYIREAISSVRSQTFEDFELVIVNDGSTDNTEKAISEFTDSRIRYIQNDKNSGLVNVRNQLVNGARGEYIAWLDADDISAPDRMRHEVRFMEKNRDFGLIGTFAEVIDENGNATNVAWKDKIKPEKFPARLIFGNCFTQSSVIIRREALPEIAYREGFAPAEDYDLWVRIAEKWKVWNIPKILTKYREHEKGQSKEKNSTKKDAVKRIILAQLDEMSVQPTEDEYEIHRANWKSAENPADFLSKRELWLLKLISANDSKKRFDPSIFRSVVADMWLSSCYANARFGLKIWKRCFQSNLASDLSWVDNKKQIGKFMIKSFVSLRKK